MVVSPSSRGCLAEEDGSPLSQAAVEHELDGVAHLVGELRHQHRVLVGAGRVAARLDGCAELDGPLGGQRDGARARPSHGQVGVTGGMG